MQQRVIVFGDSACLGEVARFLCQSTSFEVAEVSPRDELACLASIQPDVVLVDSRQVTPEQFGALISAFPDSPNPYILSLDPVTHQLAVLSSPPTSNYLADVTRLIQSLSSTLPTSQLEGT